ncbi:MAG: branched-chain amino acid ABC transporter permease [Nostocoides sp.]
MSRLSTTPAPVAAPPISATVRRGGSARANRLSGLLGVMVVAVLLSVPFVQGPATTYKLTSLCILIILASMWNLMAGFGGMVSVGLQAYIGMGAYGLLFLTDRGVNPYLAVVLSAVACALLAYPMSFLAFRLSGGYFAIGTWVMAEVCRLLIVQVDSLGGGAGRSLLVFAGLAPAQRQANVFWLAVGVLVVTIAGLLVLMRSRLGLALTAVRDDPVSAYSCGVQITRARRAVFLCSAAGCGAAGALMLCSTLRVQPDAVFAVSFSAVMIFCVVIGGVGTIEGPILGAIIYFVMQDRFAQAGSWYLVVLGLVAMAMAMWMRQGLWGFIRSRTSLSLFPTQYVVLPSDPESIPAVTDCQPAGRSGRTERPRGIVAPAASNHEKE